jgi:hypothetical protein
MSLHHARRAAGLVAATALLFPAAASAHPGWYFITAKIAKTPEIQTLTPTGGPWKPSAGAPTIADTATAAEVQAAILADPSLGYTGTSGHATTPGYDNARVTGNPGGPYTVTFAGVLAGVDVDTLAPTAANVATTQNGGANVSYSGNPATDQAAMAEQQQAVIVNDGYTYGFRETNGVGPVADGPAYTGGGGALAYTGGGMLNLSKILPGAYRGSMTELQKMEYPQAQTGIQVHATCQGVTALENPNTIAQVWDRPSDHDPFYNYIPWQKDSAGLGDEPEQWIPAVQTATGVDLSTLSTVTEFTNACTGLGGTYHPADTRSNTATAAIADAVDAATAPLKTQVNSLTAQVGSLVPQLAQLKTANTQLTNENAQLKANAPGARDLKLTLASRRISTKPITTMVTGEAGKTVTVRARISAAAAKALKLKSRTIASERKKLNNQGAALVVLSFSKKAAKALKKAKSALPTTITAASGSDTTSADAKLRT